MFSIQCTVLLAVGCVCVIVTYLMARLLPMSEDAGIAAVIVSFITALVMLLAFVLVVSLS